MSRCWWTEDHLSIFVPTKGLLMKSQGRQGIQENQAKIKMSGSDCTGLSAGLELTL